MIYFCADDYGISACGNVCIEDCLRAGVLNKVSIIPNGEITEFRERLAEYNAKLSLHINLVEGRPLSETGEVSLLISETGCFKYSFPGLLIRSLLPGRKMLEKQVYKEIRSQIQFWKKAMGEDAEVSIDSHQHTHMIPLVFRALMRVIEDEGLNVENIRIPAEPILPHLLAPSLYLKYKPLGLVKQWVLKILAFANRKKTAKVKIQSAYFMGAMFSGEMDEAKIKKLLPHYLKLAEKNNKNIEIGFHPGYLKDGGKLMDGSRKSFAKFYFSSWREKEYNTLLNFKF